MEFSDIVMIIAAALAALMSGFFFSFSNSVSDGLGKLDDKEFLKAMQSINRAVLNPVFFVCFFGAMIKLAISTIQHVNSDPDVFRLHLVATLIYLVGVLGVTIFVNVPLNNKLERFDLNSATDITSEKMRNGFEARWNFWNNIRTIASLCTLFLTLTACLLA